MAGKPYPGQVIADIIDIRFAFSGKLIRVAKSIGDNVKTGELLAALDRKLLQTELDQQLADYERTRAEFEIFVARQGTPDSDVAKFEKVRMQALLNSSVKSVETAKYRLDQADLFSPVTGLITDDGGNRTGLYVTPASNAFRVLDQSSVRFRINISGEELSDFNPGSQVSIKINGKESKASTGSCIPDGSKIYLDFRFSDTVGLTVGQPGDVYLSGS